MKINLERSFGVIVRRRRRIGEGITIIAGAAIAGLGSGLGMTSLVAGGIAIAGLGVVSVFWK